MNGGPALPSLHPKAVMRDTREYIEKGPQEVKIIIYILYNCDPCCKKRKVNNRDRDNLVLLEKALIVPGFFTGERLWEGFQASRRGEGRSRPTPWML